MARLRWFWDSHRYLDLLLTLSLHRAKVRYKQSMIGVSWAIVQAEPDHGVMGEPLRVRVEYTAGEPLTDVAIDLFLIVSDIHWRPALRSRDRCMPADAFQQPFSISVPSDVAN